MANVVTLKAGLDPHARAGDLTEEQIGKVVDIMTNPLSKFYC
jgi:ribosomal protein S13